MKPFRTLGLAASLVAGYFVLAHAQTFPGQPGPATLSGNPTTSTTSPPQFFTIQGLTAKGAPDPANDALLLYDNVAGSFKKVSPGSIASSATAGVSSLNTLTGPLAITAGTNVTVTPSGSSIRIDSSGTGGVASLNALTGALAITPGTGISVTPSGTNISIAATGGPGVTSMNTLTGALAITAGTGITVTPSGSNISIAATGGGAGVSSLNTLTGALSITAGTGISVTPSGSNINIVNTAASGAWSNTRLAKTAAYTVAPADCGSTIALGGGATYALTFGAASGYPANCVVEVLNEDNANGKAMNINGLAGSILWPLQPMMVFAQNNVWQRDPGQTRWKLPLTETIYVNHATGSDTLTCTGSVGGIAGTNKCPNDCLTTGAGACATIQNAANMIAAQWDCQNNAPFIQLASETFTEAVALRGLVCPGYLQLFITGVPATPSSVIWQCPASNVCLSVRDYSIAALNGVTLQSGGGGTATGSVGITSSQFSDVDVSNIVFGAFPSGYGLQVTQGGNFNCTGGTYSVTGNFISHWFVQGNANFVCASQVISVPNALTFTNWLQIQGPAYAQANATTFTGTGSAAGSTGQKYNISINGVALTSGAVLPGATAGATSTGGQYN